jgi:FtsZ-binding cell division protein ZapB
LGQAERGNEQGKNEAADTIRRLQAEIERLREEIEGLKQRHQSELEDEREEVKKVGLSNN